MGASSIRRPVSGGVSFIGHPLDTKIITAGVGVTHMYIRYVAIAEQSVELRLDDTIRNIALRNQASTTCIAVEGETAGEHVNRKTRILPISIAIALVNEDRPRERKLFGLVERVIGEEDPALPTNRKSLQAMPTWPITGCNFSVRRVTVTWRPQCLANAFCDLVSNGDYAVRLHSTLTH